MKKSCLLLWLTLIAVKSHAIPNNFDIYGVDEKIKQRIYASSGKEITEYVAIIDNEAMSFGKKTLEQNEEKKIGIQLKKLESTILDKVQHIIPIAKEEMSIVFYPEHNKAYITLDLIKKGDNNRFPTFERAFPARQIDKNKGVQELFVIWDKYSKKYFDLINQGKIKANDDKCPVMHCAFSFDSQDLKETLPKLQQGLVKYRHELEDIIKYSSNDVERSEAIFILANDNNYQTMVKFLINFVDDPSDLIRNNAMRVLGQILANHKAAIDLNKFLIALNYPYVTDRNKAAYVLRGIVRNDPASHKTVINKSGKILLELLKLQQPNNHDFAYDILVELSHKKYNDRDYPQWEKWLNSQAKLI